MDVYRITHPMTLAKGSHQPGFGKGCAMRAGVATAPMPRDWSVRCPQMVN
jgi:hypothetical protein